MSADKRCSAFVERFARRTAAALAAASLLLATALSTARAEVALSGSFTATQTCPAFQSFRKSSNPGDVQVEPNKTYEVIAKNKPDATHYRIIVEGAAACAVAAALSGRAGSGKVVAIVSGGNIDLDKFGQIVAQA